MGEREKDRKKKEKRERKIFAQEAEGDPQGFFSNEVRVVLREIRRTNNKLARDTVPRCSWRQGLHDGTVCWLQSSGPPPPPCPRSQAVQAPVQAVTPPETGMWGDLRAQVAPGSPLPCSLRPLSLPYRKLKQRDSDGDVREPPQGGLESPGRGPLPKDRIAIPRLDPGQRNRLGCQREVMESGWC